MRPRHLHVASNKANSAIAHAAFSLQGCVKPAVKPAPGWRQTRPSAELESQQGQCKTQASVFTQREEQWKANSMNNGEARLRIRASAHS
jgi:hypothetical protein